MREVYANPDRAVAEIAARQHGVVSIDQLHAVGLGKDMITRRLKAGRLHRVHRGVYAVGHPGISLQGRWMGAVLALGEGALLSHRSAACLWGLLPTGAKDETHVTVCGSGGRRRRTDIRVHRSTSLEPSERRSRLGIPVTSPARTLSDLRRGLSPQEWRRAARQAAVLGFNIGSDAAQPSTRSELESLFLTLCRRYRLPEPEVNVRIGGFLVDFVWRDRRLIVETDGYRYHRGRVAFDDDRARDLHLRTLGYEVIRLTYDQVTKRPGEIAAALRTVLAKSI
jgi:very-short-patch-repair endonuclease